MSRCERTPDWHRALVYGLGISGRAAARLLRSWGVEVVAVDRRRREDLELGELAGDAGVELLLGDEPERLPERVEALVLSPGVPVNRPLVVEARRRGLPVIAEVELAFPHLGGPVVGITGSNGKSTTTALTGALLESAGFAVEVCGNIGAPLSSTAVGPAERIFVTELSSFQLETIDRFRPRAAALLNLTPDHLDRHRSFADYARAKRRLFENQGPDDVAVLNADDPEVAETAVVARRRWFSRRGPVEDGCFLDGERVLETEPNGTRRELFAAADLRIPGVHNLENAMAAALLAMAVGAGPESLRAGLAGFTGLPHRLQRVAELDGVIWYDDSKGTNVDATLKSLEGFADRSVHLILGGRDKGSDPAALAATIRRKACRLYLIGEAAESFGRALDGIVDTVYSGTLERAVEEASTSAVAGEVVLLSPACASFDQYSSYVQRGEHFHLLVERLTGGADGQEAGV
jgi:UDP-N-acetylmuramoylalanine--D-glutamate ligase